MPHQKIAIVGAGIGGLTLAIALQQRGMDVEVFEQASELAEIGAGIGLFANSIKSLKRMEVLASLRSDATEPVDLIYRDGHSGEILGEVPLSRNSTYERAFGAPYIGLHRRHLQRSLLGAIDSTAIRLGHRLDRVSLVNGTPTLEFANGTRRQADLVIGADGTNSVVREWITGSQNAKYSGTSGFRGVAPVSMLPSLPRPHAAQFWVGKGKHLLHFPIGLNADFVSFLAAVDEPASWTDVGSRRPATTAEALATFAGWHPAVTEVLGAVEHQARWGLFVVDPLTSWSRGPVALIGDAAHAMLPHHGQGANQTIEDAVVLADLLATSRVDEVEPTLIEYETLRMPRARLVQELSWHTNELLHLGHGQQWNERSAMIPRFYESLTWLHEYEPEPEVANLSVQSMADPLPGSGH